jgi:hypothetical protein
MTEDQIKEGIERRDALIIERYGPGTVEMEQCPLCGFMRFACARTSEPTCVVMREMYSVSECSRCEEINRRAPEVFHWVLGVAQHLRVSR